MISEATFQASVDDQVLTTLRRYQFHVAARSAYSARLESDRTAVQIDYDAFRTKEVHCRIGLLGAEEVSPSLDSIDPKWSTPIAIDRRELDGSLRRLAAALAEGHSDLLVGDAAAFARVSDQLRETAHDYTTRVAGRAAIAHADEAWLKTDYRRVADLLAPIRGTLDTVHLRRLEYALSRIEGLDS